MCVWGRRGGEGEGGGERGLKTSIINNLAFWNEKRPETKDSLSKKQKFVRKTVTLVLAHTF